MLGKPLGRARGSQERAVVMTVVLDRPQVSEGLDRGDESASVTGVLKAKALHTAVADALLFAAPPSMMLPQLEAVRLEFTDGQLVAAATDRFALGVSRVDYHGPAATLCVAGSDAKALVKMARTLKRDEKSREVTVERLDGGAQVMFRFSTGESMTVRGLDVEFPKWRHLIAVDDSRMGEVVGMGYSPTLVARFGKVRPDEHGPGARMVMFPTVQQSGRPGPTVVRVGEDFIGLLMPIRPEGGHLWGYQRPGWLDGPASAGAAVA